MEGDSSIFQRHFILSTQRLSISSFKVSPTTSMVIPTPVDLYWTSPSSTVLSPVVSSRPIFPAMMNTPHRYSSLTTISLERRTPYFKVFSNGSQSLIFPRQGNLRNLSRLIWFRAETLMLFQVDWLVLCSIIVRVIIIREFFWLWGLTVMIIMLILIMLHG